MGRKKQDARKRDYKRRNDPLLSPKEWFDPDKEYLEDEEVYRCEYGAFSTWDRTVFYAERIDHSAEEENQFLEIKINNEGVPYIEYYRITACQDCFCYLVIPTQWEVFEPSYLSEIGIKTQQFEWFHVPFNFAFKESLRRITQRLLPYGCPGVPELKTQLKSLGAKLYVPTPSVEAKILPGQKYVFCNTSEEESGGYKCEYGTFSARDRTVFCARLYDPSAELEYRFLDININTEGIPYVNYSLILAPDDYMVTRLIIPTQWEAFGASYLSEYGFETQRFEWFLVPDHPISRITDGWLPSSRPGVPELRTKLKSLGARLYVPTPAVKAKLSPGQKHVLCDMSEGDPHFGEYGFFCE
ncbi:MAG: hypothetical protein J6S75_08960 [Thermoguttaceae bacterium]|nr:hypothetical protein [Thermoguttaceae bacterium]